MKRKALKVVERAIATLKPYGRNPRENKTAVAAVARSIEEFGFRQPIVADKQGVIVVGHVRYQAALKLKLERVPVHVATDLSARQLKAYRIADNQTGSLSEWDFDKLLVEVGDLKKGSYDLSALGFKPRQFHDLVDAVDGEDLRGAGLAIDEAWEIRVECRDEAHQREVYDRLTSEGLTCRLQVL